MLTQAGLVKLDGFRTVLRALGMRTTGESRIARHLVLVELHELALWARLNPDAVQAAE